MRKAAILIAIILSSMIIKAQNVDKHAITSKIGKQLFFQIDDTFFKDSIAIYSFAITIRITHFGKNAIVREVSSNDPIAFKIFKNLDTLKSIDFSELALGRKSIRLIVPVAILAMAHKQIPLNGSILVSDLGQAIEKLFDVPKPDLDYDIFLEPYIVRMDLNKYD
jgi:hypothetical protein